MKKRFHQAISFMLSVFLVATCFPVGTVGANSVMEIFDENRAIVTEKQYITEYRSHQLYALTPVTADDGTVSGTEIDTSQGAYVQWESNLPLLANVDSTGKVTAYDYSKRAVIELWINENIRTIPLVGDATADSIWEALDSTGTDLDDMNTDAIVAIVSTIAGETLAAGLRTALDNMNVEITATLYDSDGKVLGKDTVAFVVEKSLVANVAPTGVHITNKTTIPTTVAVGTTVQLRGFCTPTRLGQSVKFSMGSNVFDTTSKNYASVTEDGLVTFTAPGTATVRVNPSSALYATFSDTVTFTVLDPVDLPLTNFEIVGEKSVGEGKAIQLSVGNITPAGAYYGDLTWQSADPTIAVVDANGIVTGLDGGSGLSYSREVIITATAGGVSKDVKIKVTRPVVNSISSVEIEGDDSLAVNTSYTYIATIKPDRINNSSSVKREWGIIDPFTNQPVLAAADTPATDGAISVDVNGNVTAIGAGVSQIYCKATLNESVAEDTKTIVCGKAITDFEISGTSTLKEGEKTTLNINVLAPEDYETALLDTVVWSISDESVASISKTGVVLARDAGKKNGNVTATVTATVSGISKTFNITIKGNGLLSTDKLTDGSIEGVENVIVDLPRRYEMKTYPARIEGTATYWAISNDDGSEPWNVSDNYDGSNRVQKNSIASIEEVTENDIVYSIVSGTAAGHTAIHAYRKNSSLIGTGKSYVETHKDINIIEVEPKSITIKTPNKSEYLEGDTELDLTGLEVYLNYDKEIIKEYYPDAESYTEEQLTVRVTDYTVGSFDPQVFDTTQYVIVSVVRAGETYNAVIPIVVKSKVLTALNIKTPAKQIYIEGEAEIDISGIDASVDYSNYPSEDVTPIIDHSSFSMEIYNVEQQVRVYYEHAGRVVENFFSITVFEKPKVKVQVDGVLDDWTTEDITFTLSCNNPLKSIFYYYRYESESTFKRLTSNVFTVSGQKKDKVYFKAEAMGAAYNRTLTIESEPTQKYSIMLDSIVPDFTLNPEVKDYTNKGYKVNVDDLIYGVSGIMYIRFNGAFVDKSFRSFIVNENGTNTVEIKTTVGFSTTKTIEISNIDKQAPRITEITLFKSPEDAPGNKFDSNIGNYFGGDVGVSVSAEDDGVSGVNEIYYRLTDESYSPIGGWKLLAEDNTAFCQEQFKGYFEFKVVDKAGNESPSYYSDGFVRDNQKPVITGVNAVCGEKEYVANTWANDIVEFSPQATAYSGIYEYYYSVNDGEWIKLSKDMILAKDDGIYTYNFKAVSKVGIESEVYSITTKIDRTVPVIRVSAEGTIGRWSNEDVTFNLSTFNECPSGKTFYYNDGSGWQQLQDNSLVINYSTNAVYVFKAVNGAGLSSVPSDEYTVMVDKVKPSAQVICGVTEKTDSPYDLAIVPISGEAGYLQIYFNGEDVTETLKYTVSQNGTYALTIIGNNMLSSTTMIEINNFSSLPTMSFTCEKTGSTSAGITSYTGNSANVTIPLTVESLITTDVCDGAFANNKKLESVNIPNTVSSIGNAFNGCINLKEIVIPSSVTEISPNAFADCGNITICCSSNSYAQQYAIDNNISYELLDLSPVGKTSINSKTGYIFTLEKGVNDMSCVAVTGEGCTTFAVPSYVGAGTNYFGTGSIVYLFKNGNVVSTYTVVVCGDVNGDSYIDVIDSLLIRRSQKNNDVLKDHYLLAADFNNDGIVDDKDYIQVRDIAVN